MTLLVDIGNSRLKWGVLESDGTIRHGQPIAIGNGFSNDLQGIAEKAPAPQRILVSSVASPEVDKALVQWSRTIGAAKIEFVQSRAEVYGVRNAYEQPDKLGVDRWLCLVAVRNRYQMPACIVDCGTAVTLDVLNLQGQHLGGLIIPGLGLMAKSLLQGTAGIGVGGGNDNHLLGTDTSSAIQSGVAEAVCGMVERVYRQLKEETGVGLKLYFTGGNGAWVAQKVLLESTLVSTLVLEGLAVIAEDIS